MEKKKEPAKVFYDLLSDYADLKYIFVYGFYWDDKVTKIVLKKGSQTVRELTNILADVVYKNCICILWCKSVNRKNTKKSTRLLVQQNHYRLEQNRWFPELYRCCGKYNQPEAVDQINECRRKEKNQPYRFCREKSEICTYRKICCIEEEKSIFLELLQGILKTEEHLWRDNDLYKIIIREYKDIIEENEKKICLKENQWTEQALTKYLQVNHKQEVNDEEFPQKQYNRLVSMVRFFSDFSPLSVIGGALFCHMKPELNSANETMIWIRDLFPEFGLEQEYIYRCLYAMLNHQLINYEDKEYIPLKLYYRDKGILGVKEHLYLEAAEITDTKECIVQQLPLFGGVYIKPGRNILNDKQYQINIPENTKEMFTFKVDFYYHDQLPYLLEKRKRGWKGEVLEKTGEVYHLNSPYHPEIQEWKTDQVIYTIKKSDVPGFLLFIQSFGDFARLYGDKPKLEIKNISSSRVIRGKIKEHQSLLNVYYSADLAECVSKITAEKKEKTIIHPSFPPRQAELEWLEFILKKYPNLCRVFLEEDTISLIEKKLSNEIGERKGWFCGKYFDYVSRTKDIEKRMVKKYQKIFEAVEQHRVLSYDFQGKTVFIYPYALEYDVMRHLSGEKREPIDIMGYSLKEKRNVKILYSKIQVLNQDLKEEFYFSDLDKLYHILAYAIRCGIEDRQSIDEKVEHLLEYLWKPDGRGNNNYNRCIRKAWQRKVRKRKVSYEEGFHAFEMLVQKRKGDDEQRFLNDVFRYWLNQNEEIESSKSDFQMQYQTFLLACFANACKRFWLPRVGKDIKEYLNKIKPEEIWEMIRGKKNQGVENEEEDIVNEIAFYNERLKNTSVSFLLKKNRQTKIDLVYQLFGGFICAGEMLSDERIRFTVTYEKFYYRKIHMALMILKDDVEEIQPASVSEIIQKRIKNMEENQ